MNDVQETLASPIPPISPSVLPAHGTYARYYGNAREGRAGCRCAPCRNANRLWRKRRELVGPLSIGASVVATHLNQLLDQGASRRSIATASGVSLNAVKQILSGRRQRIRKSTAARLFAITSAPQGNLPVDATGSTRRVRALMALGHPILDIRAASGINHTIMCNLLDGSAARIWGRSASAVADAYERMCMTVGTSTRSLNRARREGWAPPAAWDGINVDDPATFPDVTGHCGTVRGHRIHESRGIPFCQPCRDAKAGDERERRASRAADRQGLAA